jgi:hypothetical protein
VRSSTSTSLVLDCGVYPSKVAQQVKHEQYNEYEADPAPAPDMASVSISAATEEKNENYNKDD